MYCKAFADVKIINTRRHDIGDPVQDSQSKLILQWLDDTFSCLVRVEVSKRNRAEVLGGEETD